MKSRRFPVSKSLSISLEFAIIETGIRIALVLNVTITLKGIRKMTIRLIKRGQEAEKSVQPPQKKKTDMVVTMQSWVEEFKSRKNKLDLGVLGGAVRQQ
jgi:hypothetical protein